MTGTGGGDWWRGAVIYQIYPRSFADTNADGIGDLPGVTAHLDYIAKLGVDAIWLSPFFTSPMRDFGYDVSDYRDVDPMFGTLEDFGRLVERAHALGLRVLIDQVLSHTSDRHPWFIESRASRDNEKADWYVWASPRPDGAPPNNWLSVFGGSAWAWDTRRRQYYLHNFLKSQPDLNFHNPQVRAEILDVLRFWLERFRVDGFRLDTVNYYFHDRELRSNPPSSPTTEATTTPGHVNPYSYQEHIYDKTRPENLAFLEEIRSLLERYPGSIAMGELGVDGNVASAMGQYTGNGRLQTAYSFELLTPNVSAAYVRRVIETMERDIGDGWPCWAFSNHDVARVVSRWDFAGYADRAAPLLIALLCSLKGSICLYQGEELGLAEAEVPFEQLQDPYGIEFWPEYKGRDGCRTPMPWTSAPSTAGFTTGKPWLPIPKEHCDRAVALQEADPASVLNRVRGFLRWRQTVPALRYGTIRVLDLPEPILGIEREAAGRVVTGVFNLGLEDREVPLSGKGAIEPYRVAGFSGNVTGSTLRLGVLDAFFGWRGRDTR
jgi:alpha-glucosidase